MRDKCESLRRYTRACQARTFVRDWGHLFSRCAVFSISISTLAVVGRGNGETRGRSFRVRDRAGHRRVLPDLKRTPQPTLAMRFSVPRSLSPSPVRKERYAAHPRLVIRSPLISPERHPFSSPRKSGTFRAPSISSDSEEDGYDNSTSDSSSDTSEPDVLALSACAPLSQLSLVCTLADLTTVAAHHRRKTKVRKK